MLSSLGVRGLAALTTLVTLAACSSDGSTAPTTYDYEEIIADMSAAREQAAGSGQNDRVMALTFAIGALQLGAPISSGNVVIDGRHEELSFTTLGLALAAGGDTVETTVTFLIGWRHSNADSVLVAFYTPSQVSGDALGTMFAGSALLRDWRVYRSESAARITGAAGATAVETIGGDILETVGLIVADSMWASNAALDDVAGGSATVVASGGECESSGTSVLFESGTMKSCTLQTVNVSGNAHLTQLAPEENVGSEHDIAIPAQAVAGVRVVMAAPE